MKKQLLLLFALLPASSFAYEFEVDGIYYSEIGNNHLSVEYGEIEYTGQIVIPEHVFYNDINYSVTHITDNAFNGCKSVTSVTLPTSLKSIGRRAFRECTALTSITIPESVTEIYDFAFLGCSGLTKAEFSSIEHLCSISFWNAEANPLSCAHNLYINGEIVTDVIIPMSLIFEIGNYAFCGCTSIDSVTIGNYVTSIGDYAFRHCSSLTSVNICDYVERIGNYAFYGCNSLTSFNCSSPVTYIGDYAFYLCTDLNSFIIPNTLSNIGYRVFGSCGIKSITIPQSVTSIGDEAFLGCNNLTSVIIPNSVTSIGSGTFEYCTGLTSVTIPNSVKYSGENIFSNCSNLKKVAYPNTLENPLPDSKAIAVEYPAEDAIVEEGWVYGPNKYAIYFAPLPLEGDYVMPNVTLAVGNKAFAGCDGLTSLKTSSQLRTIGDQAFASCNLQEIAIAPTVRSIGESAFANNIELREVKIGYGITEIGDKAFDGCNKIENVYITASKPPIATNNTFSSYRSALWLNNKKTQNSYFEASDCWYWFGENMKSFVTAESVKIVNQNISGKAGETLQLEATILPEDATLKDIFWKSTNTNAAIVDGNGMVTFVAPSDEECEIIAMTMYEDVEVANISVTTLPASSGDDPDESGLEEFERDVIHDATIIYNLSGVRVGASLDGLPKGIYIVRHGSKASKVAI